MIRMQQRWEVIYGHFADFIDSIDHVNAILRQRGWSEWVPFTPLGGRANEVVLVTDYPDLPAFKAEEDAAYADAEFMKAWRASADFVVQGSGTFELLAPAPHLA